MEIYREGFRAEYTGDVIDLTGATAELDGVQSVSAPKGGYVEKVIDLEIEYNTHETDRTRIGQEMESIEGVDEVTFI